MPGDQMYYFEIEIMEDANDKYVTGPAFSSLVIVVREMTKFLFRQHHSRGILRGTFTPGSRIGLGCSNMGILRS